MYGKKTIYSSRFFNWMVLVLRKTKLPTGILVLVQELNLTHLTILFRRKRWSIIY